MDVLDHLTAEHRQAESLMARLQDTEPGTEREQLVAELASALRTHMAVEEQHLYPIVREVIGQEPASEAETEHRLAREGLDQLEQLVQEPGFEAALDMVRAGIGHHVQEEEHEVFPALREQAADRLAALDPDQLEADVPDAAPARGSARAHEEPDDIIDLTKDELYKRAQEAKIPGRSTMTKDELARAISKAR